MLCHNCHLEIPQNPNNGIIFCPFCGAQNNTPAEGQIQPVNSAASSSKNKSFLSHFAFSWTPRIVLLVILIVIFIGFSGVLAYHKISTNKSVQPGTTSVLIGKTTPTKPASTVAPKTIPSNKVTVPTTLKPNATQPASAKLCYQIAGSSSRASSDLADDYSGYQLHIIYALPSDGLDHNYDINGSISTSVSAWENWLCNQTGGATLHLDTHDGILDTTFIRFAASNNTIKTGSDLPWATDANNNPYIRDDIEIYLKSLGFNDSHKLYAVYYDGTSNHSCGGGAWPPTLTGHVAAEYMQGGDPTAPTCETNKLATSAAAPGYLDFDILHETVHTLGFAPTCATHHVLSGHVSDGTTDLMYAGNQPWGIYQGLVLDINHDDYYKTGKPGCLDLANSAFLSSGGNQLPPSW